MNDYTRDILMMYGVLAALFVVFAAVIHALLRPLREFTRILWEMNVSLQKIAEAIDRDGKFSLVGEVSDLSRDISREIADIKSALVWSNPGEMDNYRKTYSDPFGDVPLSEKLDEIKIALFEIKEKLPSPDAINKHLVSPD